MMAADVKCGECGEPMELRNSRFGKFWGCTAYPECRGTHGAHPDGRPLGKPANKETKEARMKAHAAFDRLWKKGKRTRGQAYGWLKAQASVPNHIAEMSKVQCTALIELIEWEMKVPSGGDRAL